MSIQISLTAALLALSMNAIHGQSTRQPVEFLGHGSSGVPSGTMVLAPVGFGAPSFSDTGMRTWGTSQDWDTPPPIQQHRRHARAVSLNGRIYLIGGYWGPYGQVLDSVEEFDPTIGAAGIWSYKNPMNSPRYSFGCCTIGGKVYVLGGSPQSGPPQSATNRAEVYDPILDSWREIAPMSVARVGPVCAAVGGKAYVIGGMTAAGVVLNSVEAYNPDTDTWTPMQAMPGVGRYYAAGGAVDGNIYVTGGDDRSAPGASAPQSQVYCFDPVTDYWIQRAPLVSPRSVHSAVVVGGELLVIGGEVAYGVIVPTIEAFSPSANAWRAYSSLPTARDATASILLDGQLFVIGGRLMGGQNPSVDLVERLTTRTTELAILKKD